MKTVLPLVVLCCLASSVPCRAGADDEVTAATLFGVEDPPDCPLQVTASLKAVDAVSGVICRVELENISSAPHTLKVCPDRSPCMVAGLHAMIAQHGSGAGLVDICAAPTPQTHSVYLPPAAAFTVDVAIPPERIPVLARLGKEPMFVFFCQDFGDGRIVHSNVTKVVLE
ncbi:MAG: hypothetical protein O3A51_01300 [Verrucomicrobia bacterium]|nr:hypothetical protein [Verrucomicrobiota bacterium]